MDLEKLKKALNTLENYRKCTTLDFHCYGTCSNCPNDYKEEDLIDSIAVSITVIGDVIKNMERLKNGQS